MLQKEDHTIQTSGFRSILYILWRRKEAFFWILAIVVLACMNPSNSHFSLCPFNALGFHWCPGCGLGHSISWLFRGEIRASFEAHYLGIPATLIILYRIIQLLKPIKNQHDYGTSNAIRS